MNKLMARYIHKCRFSFNSFTCFGCRGHTPQSNRTLRQVLLLQTQLKRKQLFSRSRRRKYFHAALALFFNNKNKNSWKLPLIFYKMAKSKSKYRELQAKANNESETNEKLNNANEAYTTGAFKYLRLLTHGVAALQFIYGVYFYYYKVRAPLGQRSEDIIEDEMRAAARWGGKFKYLTFLNVILQAVYHTIAFLNDIFGSNEVVSNEESSLLRKIRDFIFAAWAFPVAANVCISFWVIYAWDRELIFPTSLDDIFPNWLNHVVHTNVLMLCIMDIFTCCRQYPERWPKIFSVVLMLLYITWIHIVHHYSGHWAYPMLETMNAPFLYVTFGAMIVFNLFCYYLGEFLNNIIWAPELKLMNKKET